MSDRLLRESFEKWCQIKIIDAAKAPKADALVRAFWTAWKAAAEIFYRDGASEMKERALEEISGELYGHDTGEMGNRILEAVRSLEVKK